MDVAQEPKYMIVDEHGNELPGALIANRQSGEPIPADEPLMIFRGKDIQAPQAMFLYAETCTNPFHKVIVIARRKQFLAFQANNPERVKEPD